MYNRLPHFVFIKEKGFAGYEFILGTAKPFYLYRVYTFNSEGDLNKFITKHALFNYSSARVPGYNILLCYIGTITDTRLEAVPGDAVTFEVITTFNKLINFYESERITGNENRQKKWKTSDEETGGRTPGRG